MRVDVVLRGMGRAALTECVLAADSLGPKPVTLWLPESPGDHDPFVVAAALLSRGRHVRIGTGVVPIPLRSTVALASAATTLEELFPGRFDLGVGSGNVRALLQAGVMHPGPALTVAERFLVAIAETSEHRPPVYLAAHNRGMIDLAVRRADGVILNVLAASELAGTMAYLQSCAAAAGRAPTVGMYQLASFGAPDEAARSVRRVLAGFLRSPAVGRRLFSFGSKYVPVAKAVAALPAAATDDQLEATISDDVVDDFGVTSEAALGRRLALADALGLSFVALSVFPAPLRLRKPFPPIPEQRAARDATIDALATIAALSPAVAAGVPAG